MRKSLYIVLLLHLCNTVLGQLSDVSLQEIEAPSIPAGVIIGSQLNEVSGLRSMVALEAAIIDNFTDESNSPGIFSDVAIDVQPYMLSPRKNFSYTDYIERPPMKLMDRLWRHLSVSVASTKSFEILDTSSTDALGFGLSLILINGQPSDTIEGAFRDALALHNDRLEIGSRVLLELEFSLPEADQDPDEVIEAILTELMADPESSIARSTRRQQYVEEVRGILLQLDWSGDVMGRQDLFDELYDEQFGLSSLYELRRTLADVKNIRTGWRVGLDFASAVNFPTNDFQLAYGSKSAGWLNVSHRPESRENVNGASPSEFLFLGRVIWHNEEFYDRFVTYDGQRIPSVDLDLGLKYALNKERWSIGVEAIHRFSTEIEFSLVDDFFTSETVQEQGLKYVLDFNYALFDHVTLSYNIGKNFDESFSTNGNLISLIGLSFDFGEMSIGDIFEGSIDRAESGE